MKIIGDELIITNRGAKDNELLGYFEVEMYGIAKHMRNNEVQAIFGSFRKTGNRTVLYSATVWADKDGQPGHSYESEFEDDLIALRVGRLN
jgi:hypothetical protein